jgi:hypothetical protein
MRAALRALIVCVLLGLPATALAQSGDDPKTAFVAALQKAVAGDDKTWLVAHMHIPMRYFGKRHMTVYSKSWLLAHYGEVFSPALKANIAAEKPDRYFENYQGIMIGDGGRNIWVDDFGPADGPPRFEIITVNDAPN